MAAGMPQWETITVEKIPVWARCAIVSDDYSALDDDDIKLLDRYVKKLAKRGLRLVCPIDGTYSEFEPEPAFGLACDTVDFYAERINDE